MKKFFRFVVAFFATIYSLVAAGIIFIIGILGFMTLRELSIEVNKMNFYWIFLATTLVWGVIWLLCYFYRED